MDRDRIWAVNYVQGLSETHYSEALFAAVRGQKVTHFPSRKNERYKYDKTGVFKCVETVRLLARMGVDLNENVNGQTPLLIAAQGQHPEIVAVLLKYGADPLIEDANGKTALELAGKNKKIRQLIEDALQHIYSEYYEISDPHRPPISYGIPDSLLMVLPADSLVDEEGGNEKQPGLASQEFNLGGEVSFENYDEAPSPLEPIKPVMPAAAQESGLSGTVVLSVLVMSNGKVGSVNVVKSLQPGPGGLDEAAVNAVKRVRFSPAKKAGFPVQTKIQIPVTFSK